VLHTLKARSEVDFVTAPYKDGYLLVANNLCANNQNGQCGLITQGIEPKPCFDAPPDGIIGGDWCQNERAKRGLPPLEKQFSLENP
jgi:hypothetical protein